MREVLLRHKAGSPHSKLEMAEQTEVQTGHEQPFTLESWNWGTCRAMPSSDAMVCARYCADSP